MVLQFDTGVISHYKSNTQQIRVLTETWLANNMFCPICGNEHICNFENNRPVADFYCSNCNEQYELKSKCSKSGNLGTKITDGAYTTMIERITSDTNPNFFFLTYDNYCVNNLVLVPNHFFTPKIIEQRKPLSENAKRAGWIGCNIRIENIPDSGKIYIIKKGEIVDRGTIRSDYERTKSLVTKNIETRCWIMDVLCCVDKISNNSFSLNDIYAFEEELKLKHPANNFVKDKIRQQLQYLRDKGFIEFTTRGNYKKILR